jgi:uncharacterized membrane protein YoaK (UPF0700 family)
MKPTLPALLSINSGYVDTAGFLALQGLFTSHVTGNFVTLGASLTLGTSGAVPKLLALPVFCVVVLATRLVTGRMPGLPARGLRLALAVQVGLLAAGALLAIRLGPFNDGDTLAALATGMTLVAAMAVQNAVQRTHLGTAPPTTIMTGNTTQIMLDLADLLRGTAPEAAAVIRPRRRRLGLAVATFASGCAAAACAYHYAGVWCFILPPVLGVTGLALTDGASGKAA